MTRLDIARHELAHLTAGIISAKSIGLPLNQFVGEIEVSDDGGHCLIYPSEKAIAQNVEVPYQVNRLMAMGPCSLRPISHFRSLLRAKRITPDDGISGADYQMTLRNGGDILSTGDCQVLCAVLAIVHSRSFDAAAAAIDDCCSLVMPLSEWLPANAVASAMVKSGRTFMALHSRNDPLPQWLADSIERRHVDVLALSAALQ